MPDETQRDRAFDLLHQIDMPDEQVLRDLRAVVGEAQNTPPDGKADGAISPAEWRRLHDVVTCATDLRRRVELLFAESGSRRLHYVTFYSPGSFVDETETLPVDSWDVGEAVKLARTVTARCGARPYGFTFETCDAPEPIVRDERTYTAPSRVVAKSGTYFLDADVLTLADVERLESDPTGDRYGILLSNMRNNGWARIARTATPFLHYRPFRDGDVNLAADGAPKV